MSISTGKKKQQNKNWKNNTAVPVNRYSFCYGIGLFEFCFTNSFAYFISIRYGGYISCSLRRDVLYFIWDGGGERFIKPLERTLCCLRLVLDTHGNKVAIYFISLCL